MQDAEQEVLRKYLRRIQSAGLARGRDQHVAGVVAEGEVVAIRDNCASGNVLLDFLADRVVALGGQQALDGRSRHVQQSEEQVRGIDGG